jgi:ATP-dependent Clp protease ATP-binding subunit ClpX
VNEERLLEDLREIRHVRQRLDRDEAEIVDLLRAKGYTWEQIGGALGVTRQSAWEKYGKGVEEPHRPTS